MPPRKKKHPLAPTTWWHAFGDVIDGKWETYVIRNSIMPAGAPDFPAWVPSQRRMTQNLTTYMGTWDHEPSEREIDAVIPGG